MQAVTTIGLDIAKSVFQVHGIDAAGKVIVRRQLKRRYLWKGLGADSEEKHEPASGVDTELVDSLKTLDPERPIREADIVLCVRADY